MPAHFVSNWSWKNWRDAQAVHDMYIVLFQIGAPGEAMTPAVHLLLLLKLILINVVLNLLPKIGKTITRMYP